MASISHQHTSSLFTPCSDPISNGGTKLRGPRCCHQPHRPPARSLLTVTSVYVLLERRRCCCQTPGFPGSLVSSSAVPRHTHQQEHAASTQRLSLPGTSCFGQLTSAWQNQGFSLGNTGPSPSPRGFLITESGPYAFPFQSTRVIPAVPTLSPCTFSFWSIMELNMNAAKRRIIEV